MRHYELIIFDMDGTIADTSRGIINSIRYTIREMNLPEIGLEKMYSHVGPPMEESYHRNFGLVGDSLIRAISLHKEYALKKGYQELAIYDGMEDLLSELHKRGYKMAVATLKPHTTVMKILQNVGLIDKFDLVIGANTECPMTKSQQIEMCVSKLGSAKAKTVLVGDSVHDAVGAANAQIDFIAVTYGFGFSPEKDIPYPHVAKCASPSDIRAFFGND